MSGEYEREVPIGRVGSLWWFARLLRTTACGRPNIGNRQKFHERVADILERKWLTNGGRYVAEFERRIAELCGVEHCVAMCNGTVALEIAVRALGMTGEVIVPSFTFIATANAAMAGITPVFCDIDPLTHNLDPQNRADDHAAHQRHNWCSCVGQGL